MESPHSYDSEEDLEQCSICAEDLTIEVSTAQIDDNPPTCADCVSNLIRRVINGEDKYPVRMNGRSFEPSIFRHVLDHSLLEQYKECERENKTPPADRVYCACGAFVGERIKISPGQESPHFFFGCNNNTCRRLYCLVCATLIDGSNTMSDHGCTTKTQALNDEHQKILDSGERGTEYQLCPKCARIIYRTSACNHMSCPCGEHFCYVCGESHRAGDSHWGSGKGQCPMYPPTSDSADRAPPAIAAPRPAPAAVGNAQGFLHVFELPGVREVDGMNEALEAPFELPGVRQTNGMNEALEAPHAIDPLGRRDRLPHWNDLLARARRSVSPPQHPDALQDPRHAAQAHSFQPPVGLVQHQEAMHDHPRPAQEQLDLPQPYAFRFGGDGVHPPRRQSPFHQVFGLPAAAAPSARNIPAPRDVSDRPGFTRAPVDRQIDEHLATRDDFVDFETFAGPHLRAWRDDQLNNPNSTHDTMGNLLTQVSEQNNPPQPRDAMGNRVRAISRRPPRVSTAELRARQRAERAARAARRHGLPPQ